MTKKRKKSRKSSRVKGMIWTDFSSSVITTATGSSKYIYASDILNDLASAAEDGIGGGSQEGQNLKVLRSWYEVTFDSDQPAFVQPLIVAVQAGNSITSGTVTGAGESIRENLDEKISGDFAWERLGDPVPLRKKASGIYSATIRKNVTKWQRRAAQFENAPSAYEPDYQTVFWIQQTSATGAQQINSSKLHCIEGVLERNAINRNWL